MQPHAIDYGVSADKYWDKSFEEIILTAESEKRKRIASLKQEATFDYKLAQLIMFAFNDPKKMPKQSAHYAFIDEAEKEKKDNQPKKQGWEIMKEQMMHRAIKAKQKGGG